MLTQTANELIGKGAKIKHSDDLDLQGRRGTIDTITLFGNGATVRILLNRPTQFITLPIEQLEYCQCGDSEGCSLCADSNQVIEALNVCPTCQAIEPIGEPDRERTQWWCPEHLPIKITESNSTKSTSPADAWRKVFQIISDCDYRDDRELIRLLEAAREEDGCGPYVPEIAAVGLTAEEFDEVVLTHERLKPTKSTCKHCHKPIIQMSTTGAWVHDIKGRADMPVDCEGGNIDAVAAPVIGQHTT